MTHTAVIMIFSLKNTPMIPVHRRVHTRTRTHPNPVTRGQRRDTRSSGETRFWPTPPPNLPHGIMLQGHTAPANMHTDAMKHTAVLFYSDGTQGG